MRANTRYALFGGGGVLVVGLLVGGVAYLQGSIPGLAGVQSGPDELKYVPAEASLIAYANVRDVMQSNLGARLRAARPDLDGQQRFRDQTGVDLENDIDYIVAAMVPTGEERPDGLVLLTGRFDRSRLEALAREQGGAFEEYEGHTVVSRAMGDDGTELAMSFVESGVLAFGSDGLVRRAIDVSSGHGELDVTSEDGLMGLMTHVRRTDNAWVVAQFEDNDALQFLPGEIATQMPPLTAMAVGGRVNGGVSAMLTAETRDEQSSQDLRDVLQGFLALARMQTDTQPDLRALLDSVQLSSSDTAVSLSFDLPAEILDRAFSESDPLGDDSR